MIKYKITYVSSITKLSSEILKINIDWKWSCSHWCKNRIKWIYIWKFVSQWEIWYLHLSLFKMLEDYLFCFDSLNPILFVNFSAVFACTWNFCFGSSEIWIKKCIKIQLQKKRKKTAKIFTLIPISNFKSLYFCKVRAFSSQLVNNKG